MSNVIMDYKKFGDTIYARFDRGDEVLSGILNICKKEKILSATFSGIGGCGDVTVSTYIPEKNEFTPHNKTGLLEMISINGNISADNEDNIFEHTHAMFSYLENDEVKFLGGHLTKAVVSYTAEIEIKPVKNSVIRRKHDGITGITVWDL
jgi:predicted DNA-binding protein with PD1-like motif